MSLRQCIVLIAIVCFLSSCGGSSTAPQKQEEQFLPPNPAGMSLPGEDGDAAAGAVLSLLPSAVPESQRKDGLLTTRIRAVIDPDATVAQVNQVLEDHEASIVSMRQGNPTVILRVPELADESEAEAKAAALAETDAFLAATPGRGFGASAPGTSVPPATVTTAEVPPAWDNEGPIPFEQVTEMTLLQTWAVRELVDDDVTVILVDEWSHFPEDRDDIPGLSYPDVANEHLSIEELTRDGSRYIGNRGFHHASLLGAGWDDSDQIVGVHPGAKIQAVGIGGLDMSEILSLMSYRIDLTTGPVVLVTPFGFSYDPTTPIPFYSAMLAAEWRFYVRVDDLEDRVLHVSSAGDTGLLSSHDQTSHTTSPWNIAASYQSITDYMNDQPTSVQSIAEFVEFEQTLGIGLNFPRDAIENVLIVGASGGELGEPLPNTSLLPQVMVPGENLVGICTDTDPGFGADASLCDGTLARYSGSGTAAALVGGLASYLWNIDPNRSREDIVNAIQFGSQFGAAYGSINAYYSILYMDRSMNDPQVREMLLDVTGDSDNFPFLDEPNGIFDEKDIKVFLDRFAVVNGDPTHLDDYRFDLNGDDFVGGITVAAFDLDVDQPPSFEQFSFTAGGTDVEVDESAMTEQEILCYYAYSDLYLGNTTERDILLSECGNATGLFVRIEDMPERGSPEGTAEVTIIAGFNDNDGGVSYREGVEIRLRGESLDAEPSEGITDENGRFTTTVTFEDDDNEMILEAEADYENEEAETEAMTLRHNMIEVVRRYAYADAVVFCSYNEDQGIPAVRIINQYVSDESENFGLFETVQETSGSGTRVGMNVSGTGRSDVTINLTSTANSLSVDYTSEASGSITLENPNFDILSYQAQGQSAVELSVEFIVWGEPANFSATGFTSTPEYEVGLDGPDDYIFECGSNEDEEACPTISESGQLPPGEYDFDVYHYSQGYIRWFRACTDCTTQGTQSEEGTMSVGFEVSHGN